MGKTLAAVGFFLIGLALVGAGIAAFFADKMVAAVMAFVVVGFLATFVCSKQTNGEKKA